MRWWKEWTFPRYLDRRSLSPLRHPEVLLIRNRVWQRAGFTWTGKERDGRESCVKDRCRKEKNLITTPSESQRATQVCLTLMSVSSTPVLSAYSITLGWAENSHHRHDDLALKYRLWSSSRTVCILMGHSVTLHLVWLLTDNTSICKRNQQTAFPLNKKNLFTLCQQSTALLLRSHSPPELHLKHEDWQHTVEMTVFQLLFVSWKSRIQELCSGVTLTWCWCKLRHPWCWQLATGEVRFSHWTSRLQTGERTVRQHNLSTHTHTCLSVCHIFEETFKPHHTPEENF